MSTHIHNKKQTFQQHLPVQLVSQLVGLFELLELLVTRPIELELLIPRLVELLELLVPRLVELLELLVPRLVELPELLTRYRLNSLSSLSRGRLNLSSLSRDWLNCLSFLSRDWLNCLSFLFRYRLNSLSSSPVCSVLYIRHLKIQEEEIRGMEIFRHVNAQPSRTAVEPK